MAPPHGLQRSARSLSHLARGDRVAVPGHLQSSAYEKDGEKRIRAEVAAAVTFRRLRSWRGESKGSSDPAPDAPPADDDTRF